jgi:hypothetical protein
MMPIHRIALLLLLALGTCSAKRSRDVPLEPDLRIPTRLPTDREVADSGVRSKLASTMPWFPTHNITCNGRPCRPGEGNLQHFREETKRGWRYKQWTQPYIHREAWVQARSREIPHAPDPKAAYAKLVAVARRVQTRGLVVVTSGDWDYRELVLNWVLHAHKKMHWFNALVLAMDRELYTDLVHRRIPASDHHALLQPWNDTCLQRHIQAVRMERQLAVAALVAAGLDVLHTDATCVFVRDFMPYLRALPADVDFMAQRDDWPSDPVRRVGSAANAGLYYARGAAKPDAVSRFLTGVVDRGLIEFYLRWNNIPDQYGLSFLLGDLKRIATSVRSNETTIGTLHPKGSHCAQKKECLRAGFLPYDRFPRSGDWASLKASADVYHLTFGCMQEDAPCSVPAIRPFRGHRQRLDRYEAVDFEDQVGTLRLLGLWLVDADPDYRFRPPKNEF